MFSILATSSISRRLALGAVALAIGSSALAPVAANASTTITTSFTVTATVLSSCIVAASPLLFGNYDPTSSSATNGATTVVVTCTNGAGYNVGLNQGTGTGATVAVHKMTQVSGSATLNYTLYSDTGRSTVWGNTIGTNTQTGTGTALAQTFNVYGQIPAQQTAVAGAYTDSVTVSVTY